MARLFLFVSWVFILAIYGGGVAVAGETGDEPAATPATDTAIASEGVPPPQGAGKGKPDKMEPVIMARVGSATITVEQFMRFLTQNPQRVREATTVSGKAAMLREAIEGRLILAAMKQEGLLDEDESPQKQRAAFKKFSDAHFPLPPVPAEEALREHYEKHKEAYGIPAKVRLSQILIRVPDGAGEEGIAQARHRAEQALTRIESGEPFSVVAAEETENTVIGHRKGDVGFVERNRLPWLAEALAGLAVGQHTGVLRSPAGFDILMLTDVRDAVYTPFEQAREEVAKRMRKKGQEEARAKYIKHLASLVEISIELDELKDAYPNGIFP